MHLSSLRTSLVQAQHFDNDFYNEDQNLDIVEVKMIRNPVIKMASALMNVCTENEHLKNSI